MLLRKHKYLISLLIVLALTLAPLGSKVSAATGDHPPCTPKAAVFFGLPTWYKYLPGTTIEDPFAPHLDQNTFPGGTNGSNHNGKVEPGEMTVCHVTLNNLSDIWLIAAAVLEMLLRLAGFIAVIFVIFGGVQYILSQADPSRTKAARETIINALIGLVIAVVASAIVTFAAGRFT